MVGPTRGRRIVTRAGRPLSDEAAYEMVMLYQYRRLPIERIARRYGLTLPQAREVIGRRISGSCCG